jgi:hypothetical protein
MGKKSAGTKHPGEKVQRDKMSRGTKHPATEWAGQNVRGDKTSVGKRKRPARKKVPFPNSHNLLLLPLLAILFYNNYIL